MALAYYDDGEWKYWDQSILRPHNGEGLYRLPTAAETLYTDDELAAYGLARVTRDAVPEGKRVASVTLGEKDGLPHEFLTLEDVHPTVDDVAAERERRLALGFDYDFGDARGVHRFATSEADMRGWDEVTKWAHAAIALGDPDATMHILTETGPCVVTAQEWQSVLMAATAARQPLWAASFALQAMSPIPSDYATNEAYWQSP